MKKLLWVGDAAIPSGFARATHEILDTLRREYEIFVLGINYRGDPHDYPYKIWSAAPGGDWYGIGRLIWMCDMMKNDYGSAPDVIVLQNDGWNIQDYVSKLRAKKPNGEFMFPEYAGIPIVAAVPIDGKNFQAGWLNGVSLTIFWCEWALQEARLGGFKGAAKVIPLGVDTAMYFPDDKIAARHACRLPSTMDHVFIVGNVNRNQPRKRWDLTIKYFANWIRTYQVDDAYLYLHAAPTGDNVLHVEQLLRYYGVHTRAAFMEPQAWYGVSEEQMRNTYNSFDVLMSTTQGEGFGLPALEAMACRVPCILPDWAAFSDWAKRGAWLVPCTSTAIGAPYVNVIGGIPDESHMVRAMHKLYLDKNAREQNAQAAYECATQPAFRWEYIGDQWIAALGALFGAETPQEVASTTV